MFTVMSCTPCAQGSGPGRGLDLASGAIRYGYVCLPDGRIVQHNKALSMESQRLGSTKLTEFYTTKLVLSTDNSRKSENLIRRRFKLQSDDENISKKSL